MDLRPQLAEDFLDAILGDLEINEKAARIQEGSALPEEREALRVEWAALILRRFKSKEIRCELGCSIYCPHEGPVQEFIRKYPEHLGAIKLVKEEALRRWPDTTFRLQLFSDPEISHVIFEGQSITLDIQTTLEFGEDFPDSPYGRACDDWVAWLALSSEELLPGLNFFPRLQCQ